MEIPPYMKTKRLGGPGGGFARACGGSIASSNGSASATPPRPRKSVPRCSLIAIRRLLLLAAVPKRLSRHHLQEQLVEAEIRVLHPTLEILNLLGIRLGKPGSAHRETIELLDDAVID